MHVLLYLMNICELMMPYYAERVWREIDLREKMNQIFRYEAQDDNGRSDVC